MRFRRQRRPPHDYEYEFEHAEHDIGSIAVKRLRAANLVPPINGIHIAEYVHITITEELTPELTARIADALDDIPHKIEQVPPGHGVLYRRP